MGPREATGLRLATGFGDQSAYFRRNLNEERSNLRLGYHEPRPGKSGKIVALTIRSSRRRFVASACALALR